MKSEITNYILPKFYEQFTIETREISELTCLNKLKFLIKRPTCNIKVHILVHVYDVDR